MNLPHNKPSRQYPYIDGHRIIRTNNLYLDSPITIDGEIATQSISATYTAGYVCVAEVRQ